MDYSILKPKVTEVLAEHPDWTDQQVAEELNRPSITQIVSRFASFRTLAGVLTEDEYASVKTAFTTAAAQSPRTADMQAMMLMPGDDAGNGGGIDFGAEPVRQAIDAWQDAGLVTESLAGKLKSLAEQLVSWSEANGIASLRAGHVEQARSMP